MFHIVSITLKGIFKDRIFQGIMMLSLLLMTIPSIATLSMRQMTELSITLSLSLISFILLLLAVFLGATSIWRDIERRYTFSVISLPITRSSYLLGRFIGISLFLLLTSSFLGAAACFIIKITSGMYQSPAGQPVVWLYIVAALVFTTLKYILLAAVGILLSSLSTSFFLPVFGTICTFFASSITQQVYEFVHSPASSKEVGPILKAAATTVYYLLPNLSGFDLKVNAIYSIPPNITGLFLTLLYFLSYCSILLGAACLIFGRREMK